MGQPGAARGRAADSRRAAVLGGRGRRVAAAAGSVLDGGAGLDDLRGGRVDPDRREEWTLSDVLVVTAVPVERAAVLDRFDGVEPVQVGPYGGGWAKTGAGAVTVLAGGVGPARAAACAATALALDRPAVVLVAGIGGGFAGRAGVGDVVVADLVVHADLGSDSPDGFLSIDRLGFAPDRTAPRPDLVALAADRTGAVVGPILTVSTVTGTAAAATALVDRYRPAAEGMEGAGVWAAAEAHRVPFLEIRAISNPVGVRDRAGWDVPAALDRLGRAVADLLREPLR
jgi:futalosine hydrolase